MGRADRIAQKQTDTGGESHVRSTRLLLVEDHRPAAQALATSLESLADDVDVRIANSLGDALLRVQSDPPYSAVICDLGLPDANGTQAPEQLRKLDPDLVIVVLTGEAMMGSALELVRMGIQDYLAKGHATPQGILTAVRVARARLQREQRVRSEIYRDPLTRVLNRKGMEQVLGRIDGERESEHLPRALLMIDVDRFKEINDKFGHAAGDGVLCQVAARLAHAIRATDHLCRYGGDEFFIVAEDVDSAADVETIACKLLACFGDPVKIGGDVIPVGITIGAALYPRHAASTRELLHLADLAMYTAKRNGRNGWALFDPEQVGRG